MTDRQRQTENPRPQQFDRKGITRLEHTEVEKAREKERFKEGYHDRHPFTINRAIKPMANGAGLDHSIIIQLSGHSMRVGVAQDMMANGIGILPIMQAGGWRSMNIVGRYVQEASVTQNGIAQLFRRPPL